MRRELLPGGGEFNEPSLRERGELEREQVLNVAIRAFEDFTRKAAQEDRPITVETRYFLQRIKRTGTPSLRDAAETLQERAGRPGISSTLRVMLLDTSRRCRTADQFIASVGESTPVVGEEDDDDDEDPVTGPAILPMPNALAQPVMKQTGLIGRQGAAEAPKEFVRVVFATEDERKTALAAQDSSKRAAALENMRVRWEKSFENSRRAARSFVQSHPDFILSLEATKDALEAQADLVLHQWSMNPDVVTHEYSETFFQAYVSAFAHADDEAQAFDSAVEGLIGLRCRIAEMEDAANLQEHSEIIPEDPALETPTLPGASEQPEESLAPSEIQPVFDQTPEERLGVSFDASAEDVEAAFAQAMRGLDLESENDRQMIVAVQVARERMLQRAEQRRHDADRVRLIREALGPASGTPREIVLDVPKTEKPEGWWSRTFSTPGAKIRALFAGVAGLVGVAGAGAIALHEFGENDTDPSHVVAGALEDFETSDGSADTFDTNSDGDTGLESSESEVAEQIETPNTDHVTAPRETLWKVLSEKIRGRGLRPTHEKIMTLKHYADLENPGVDWDTLQIGQVIHLASVESMLDQMEGKVAPLPESGFRGVLADDSIATDSVPASTFSEEVQRINRVVDRGMTPEFAEAKAYSDIPRNGHEKHAMVKGEWIYKIIHLMLGESGLNWSAPRMARLKNMTLQENGLSEAQAAKLPPGAIVSFERVLQEIQTMKAAKEKGKKK